MKAKKYLDITLTPIFLNPKYVNATLTPMFLHPKYRYINVTDPTYSHTGIFLNPKLLKHHFPPPKKILKCTKQNFRQGRDISHAKVGDPLSLTFEVHDNNDDDGGGGGGGNSFRSLFSSSSFDLFVREVVATDGIDASEILLVDERGECRRVNNTESACGHLQNLS